jgi:nitric oxide reductase NorD protein
VQDIKHALHELRQQQVNSYAIAIEEQARHYLPRMFGVDHYCILADPKELVPAVMGLYTRLAGNV